MKTPTIKLYSRVKNGIVTRLLSTATDSKEIIETDVLIGEGHGDDYAHPQTRYQLMDKHGFYNYKLENGIMTERTPEEKQAELDARPVPQATAAEVRAKRDKLLTSTDWTQTLDAPISPASREEMRVYRQALRDITEQAGFPADAVFPVEPVMEKATPDPIDNAVDIMIGGADNA